MTKFISLNFISLNFWFNTTPPSLTPLFSYILIGFTFFLLILTILFKTLKKKKGESKNFYLEGWRKAQDFCATNSVLGFIFIFMNSQRIPFLSARFWYPVWALEMLIWLYFIYKFFKNIPNKVNKATQEENYKKYLP